MKREPRTPREDPCSNLCVRSPPHLRRGRRRNLRAHELLPISPRSIRRGQKKTRFLRETIIVTFVSFPRHLWPEFNRLITRLANILLLSICHRILNAILIRSTVLLPSIKNFVLRLDLYIYTFRIYFHRLIKDRGLNIPVRSGKIVIVYFGQHFTSID